MPCAIPLSEPLFVLGTLFILLVYFLPGGLAGLAAPAAAGGAVSRCSTRTRHAAADAGRARGEAARMRTAAAARRRTAASGSPTSCAARASRCS